MYYNNSFQQSNNYYNAYKEELKRIDKKQNNHLKDLLLKLSLSIFTLGIIAILAVFIIDFLTRKNKSFTSSYINTKEFQTTKQNQQNEKLERIKLSEVELPQSIQLQKYINEPEEKLLLRATDTLKKDTKNRDITISNEEVSLVVQIIMNQVQKKSKSKLEQALKMAEKKDESYKRQTLKELNHYNKIIIISDNSIVQNNSEIDQIRVNMNKIMNEPIIDKVDPLYTHGIKKEIVFRANEMRVIVVQKGDTLSRIAKKAYGNCNAYPKLYKANPEIIRNPNQIFIGQRLRIPT